MTGFAMGPALLFCPADRPERYAKAAERADAVILDLEDAVAPADKPAARAALTASSPDWSRTIVRVNPAGTEDLDADLVALVGTGCRTVMLAKSSCAADAQAVEGYDVVALVETAPGVLRVSEIAAAANVVALMWGAEDLVASLGGTSSRHPDGRYRDVARHARSAVLLAARAHAKVAIDAVHLDIADLDGLAEEVRDAVASGFGATACIHPSQVDVTRAGYRPPDDEIAWARAVLEVAASTRGVFTHEGRMVDGPVLKHAEQILRRAH